MKLYLLAAGYATRMYPLTRARAKPLLDVAGRPILAHILDRLVDLDDVSEAVVISNARFAADFRSFAEDFVTEQGAKLPLRVLDDGTTDDAGRLGAIGDLALALREVPPGDEDFVVAAGDNLLGFDLRPVQAELRRRQAPVLVARQVTREGPSAYNEVTLSSEPGSEGRVVSFREKPPDPRTDLAAIALYFLPARIAEVLPRYLAQGGNPDAPGHFIAWLVGETPVFALPMEGEWFDIGSLEGLEHARAHFRPGL